MFLFTGFTVDNICGDHQSSVDDIMKRGLVWKAGYETIEEFGMWSLSLYVVVLRP